MSQPPPAYYPQQQGAYPAYPPQYGQNVQYVYPQGHVYTAQPTTVIMDDCHHHHHHCEERGGGGEMANACCLAALVACLCACCLGSCR